MKLQKGFKALAKSTAGMVSNIKTVKVGKMRILPPYTIDKNIKLCPGEKFKGQPAAVTCSGFLVGPDLLVTAGHCIQNTKDCSKVSWVFDYKVKEKTDRADVMVPAENLYRCRRVIDTKLEMTKEVKKDYALVQLDRVVKDRAPLEYRVEGKIDLETPVAVIGHPSGLPQKYSPDATVQKNDHENFFVTNLDTFGGNSGSAVFNEKTGVVEGILVRGAKDYEKDGRCKRVHKVGQDIKDLARYGESVTRIDQIPTLKYRKAYLAAAKKGNAKKLEELIKLTVDKGIYDNEYSNALHYAAKGRSIKASKFLLEQGLDVNAVNSKGQTALHLAAKAQATKLVRFLVANGADVLAVDGKGKKSSKYLKLKSLKTKAWLKIQERKARKKARNSKV